jgi:hypothetical protein
LTQRGAQKRAERERQVGLNPDDHAARWLAEHDPQSEAEPPKAASKSRNLHRWRRRQGRENG